MNPASRSRTTPSSSCSTAITSRSSSSFLTPPGSEKWEIVIDTNDPGLHADSRFTEPGAAVELVPLSLVVCREPTATQRFPIADRGTPVKPHTRRFPVGAEVTASGVHFRVWAPVRKTVEVVFDGGASRSTPSRRGGLFLGRGAERARWLALQIQAGRRRNLSRSGIALPAGGSARLVGGGRCRRLSVGPTRIGAASPSRIR